MEESVGFSSRRQQDAMEESVGLSSGPQQDAMKESCPQQVVGEPKCLEDECRSVKRTEPPFRKNEFKPHCLVWTPFVPLTVAMPWIGHLGITDSEGEVHEFMYGSGSHGCGLSYGPICRYYPLDQHRAAEPLDSGIDFGYLRMQSFVCNHVCSNNCHSFAAWALDHVAYEGCTHWTMVEIAVRMFFFGRFASMLMFLYWFVPSALFFYFIPSTFIYLVVTPLCLFCVPNFIRRKLYDYFGHGQRPLHDDFSEPQNLKSESDSLAEAENAPLKQFMDEIDADMNEMMNVIGKPRLDST